MLIVITRTIVDIDNNSSNTIKFVIGMIITVINIKPDSSRGMLCNHSYLYAVLLGPKTLLCVACHAAPFLCPT